MGSIPITRSTSAFLQSLLELRPSVHDIGAAKVLDDVGMMQRHDCPKVVSTERGPNRSGRSQHRFLGQEQPVARAALG